MGEARCQRVSNIIDKHKSGMSRITLWILSWFGLLIILSVFVLCFRKGKGKINKGMLHRWDSLKWIQAEPSESTCRKL